MMDSKQQRKTSELPFSARSLIAISVLLVSFVAATAGAGTPSGVITCSIRGEGNNSKGVLVGGLLFSPLIGVEANPVAIRLVNTGSDCDGSAVTGADVPITQVSVALNMKVRQATCENFLTAPDFGRAVLRIAWRGEAVDGRPVLVARTKTDVASVAFDADSHVWTLTSAEIQSGAFAGRVATLHVALDDDPSVYEWLATCGPNARYKGFRFGVGNPSTIEVN